MPRMMLEEDNGLKVATDEIMNRETGGVWFSPSVAGGTRWRVQLDSCPASELPAKKAIIWATWGTGGSALDLLHLRGFWEAAPDKTGQWVGGVYFHLP